MSSAAANADLPPLLPRPSIFISYASENRAAARLLRDALETAGLDVWYDENELGGGDAWDQKIRRQIRECTYFMPVISAQTEARREGYFRREWRLAVDRSHDMADDVMFLIPVVIDRTPEGGARVPEKFLTVQWLKLPGGAATSALTTLAQRLAHGEHVAPAAATGPRPTPARAARPPHVDSQPAADGPLPMPPFPASPAGKGQNLKYFADIIWWGFTVVRLVVKRLPKWVRVLLIIWFFVSFISRCSHDSGEPAATRRRATPAAAGQKSDEPATADRPESPSTKNAETLAALKDTAARLRASAKQNPDGLTRGISELGAALAESAAKNFHPPEGIAPLPQATALTLDLIPFAAFANPGNEKFAAAVFSAFFVKVAVALDRRVGMDAVQPAPADKAAQLARARERGSSHIVVTQFSSKGEISKITVSLFAVNSGEDLWSGTYPVQGSDPEATATTIATAVLAALPKS
ncbi:MAG: TIR domain-containing protein [Undibacterium sp.]|nr:TIR domain-containing protein [Opitutaceae bacterium]